MSCSEIFERKRLLDRLRAFVAAVLLAAVALSALPLEAAAALGVEESFTFGVMSDPHYFPAEYQGTRAEDYQNQTSGDLRLMGENEALTTAAVDQMIEEGNLPKVLLVTGDLSSEGEEASHRGFAEQMARLQEKGVTVLVIPGNHDLYNSSAMTFQDDTQVRDNGTGSLYTTEAEFREIYASMGYDENATVQASGGTIESVDYYVENLGEDGIADCQGGLSYVARTSGGVAFIMIDTEVYTTDFNGNTVAAGSGGGMMSDALRAWVTQQAAELTEQGYAIVAGVHHPVLNHQTTAETEFITDRIDVQSGEGGTAKDNSNIIATELADAGIHYVFSGHMHENDVASYTTPTGNVIYDLETGGLCAYPSPYRYATLSATDDGELSLSVSSMSVDNAPMNQRLAEAGGTELIDTGDVDVQEYEKNAMYGDKNAEGESFITRLVMRYAARYLDQLTDIPAALENIAGINLSDTVMGLLPDLLGGGTSVDLDGLGTIDISYSTDPSDPDGSGVHLNPSGVAGILSSVTIRDEDIREELQSVLDQIEAGYIANGRLEQEISALLENVGAVNLLSPENPDEMGEVHYTLRQLLQDMFCRHNSGEDDTEMSPQMRQALNNLATSELLQNKVEQVLGEVLFPLINEVLGTVTIDIDNVFHGNVSWTTAASSLLGLGDNPSIATVLDKFGLDLTGEEGLLNDLIAQYLTSSVYNQIGGLVNAMVSGFAADGDGLDDVVDGDAVTLEASMNPEPSPTIENGALPDQVSMSLDSENAATSRNFSWYTSTDVTDTDVQVIAADGLADAQAAEEALDGGEGTSFEGTSESANKAKVTLNLILITNYEIVQESHHTATATVPAGDFYYRVGSSDDGYWSDPVLVDGDAEDASEGYTAIVVADSQGASEADYQAYEQVLTEAETSTADEAFALHLGDMVDDGTNENYWSWLMNTDASRAVATMPVAGNHEARQDDEQLANAVAAHYNVDIPEQDTSTGIYYSFVYGDVTYIVLNTNDGDAAVGEAQRAWAAGVADGAETTWTILVTHKAPYSKGSHQSDSDVVALRGWLDDFCAQHDVDLVLSGHDHTYMRTPSLSDGAEVGVTTKSVTDAAGNSYEAQVNPSGTTFVIPSTSGSKYYDIVDNSLPTAFSWQGYQPVWSTLEIDGDTLFWRSYAYDAEKDESTCIDSFAIAKDDNVSAAEKVMGMIDALPDPNAGSEAILAAEADVDAARAAYEALAEADRAQVSNLSKLEQLEQLIVVYQDISGKNTVDLSTGIYYDGKDDDEGQRRAAFKEAIANPDVGTIILPGDYSTAIGEYSGNTLNDQYYTVNHNVVIRAADGSQGYADLRRCGFIVTDGATLVLEDVRLQAWQKKPRIGNTTPMNMIRVENGTLIANGNTSVLVNRDDGSTDGFKDESWRGHAIVVGNPDKGSATGERAVYLNLSESGTISGLRDSVVQHAESSSASDHVYINGGSYNTIYGGNSSVNLSCGLEINGGTFTKVTSYGDLIVTGGTFNGGSVDYPIYMGDSADLYVENAASFSAGTSSKVFHIAGELHISSDALAKLSSDLGLEISAGTVGSSGWPLTATATGLGEGSDGTIFSVGQQITTMPGMAANQAGALATTVSGSTLSATAALAPGQSAFTYARYHVAASSPLMSYIDGNTGSVYAYSGYTQISNPVATVSISADQGPVVAKEGESWPTVQLTAHVEPSDATQLVTWSTSDESVASVDADGTVTFKAGGQVTITAKHATTGAVATMTLYAVEPTLSGSPTFGAESYEGQQYTLKLAMGDAQLTTLPEGYGVQWSVTPEDAAQATADASNPLRAMLTRLTSDAQELALTATLTKDGEPTNVTASMQVTMEKGVVAPSHEVLRGLIGVTVTDGNQTVNHGEKNVGLVANTEGQSDAYTVSNPYRQADAAGGTTWKVEVTVHAVPHVAAYGTEVGYAHELAEGQLADQTVTLTYNEATDAWSLDSGATVAYAVTCDATVFTVTPDEGNTSRVFNNNPQAFAFKTDHPNGASAFSVQYRASGTEDWSTTPPTNAGTYDVLVRCGAQGSYVAYSKVFEGGLVIAKADQAAPTVTYVRNADGTLTATFDDGSLEWSANEDFAAAQDVPEGGLTLGAAGTTYVRAKGDENCNPGAPATITVVRVSFDDGDGVAAPEESDAELTGNATVLLPAGEKVGEGQMPTATWDEHSFLGWKTAGGAEFTAETVVSESLTVTAQWDPPAPEPEPAAPMAPTAEQVAQMSGISVALSGVNELNSEEAGGAHPNVLFSAAEGADAALLANSLTVGEPALGDDGAWTAQVTLDGGAYLDAYSAQYGTHYFADPEDQAGTRAFSLAWDEATGAWSVAAGQQAAFSFDITCLTLRPASAEIYTGGTSATGGHFVDQYVVDGQGNAYTIGELNALLGGAEASVRYYDESGNEIADDTVPGTYEARIVVGGAARAVDETLSVSVSGQEYTYALEPAELVVRSVSSAADAEAGELNVPLVDGSDPSAVAAALASADGGVVAALPDGTTVLFNGNADATISDYGDVTLLSDDLLPGPREGELVAHAEEQLGVEVGTPDTYDFQYLDLVDSSQSNAWVSSTLGTDVYWRIPEGADPESVRVYHFAGLHRDYDADDAEVSGLIAASTVETVAIDVNEEAGYVSFHVPESGFSPFLMTWELAGSGQGDGGQGGTGQGGTGQPGGGSGTGIGSGSGTGAGNETSNLPTDEGLPAAGDASADAFPVAAIGVTLVATGVYALLRIRARSRRR